MDRVKLVVTIDGFERADDVTNEEHATSVAKWVWAALREAMRPQSGDDLLVEAQYE